MYQTGDNSGRGEPKIFIGIIAYRSKASIYDAMQFRTCLCVYRFIVGKEITLEESFDEFDQESVDELEQIRKKHRENLLTQANWDR